MRRSVLGLAFIVMIAAMVVVGAQTPPGQTPQTTTPAARPAAAPDQARTVTVEGCLVREADVPGFKPNPAEKVGVAEDYILMSAKMVMGSAPAPAMAQAKPGDTPVGTSGAEGAMMFDVEGISDAQLKPNVGKRVQVEGTFENITGAKEKPTTAGDLVELRGTVIRQAAGECAAK